MTSSLLKIFLPALVSLLVGFAVTPHLTTWMYKARMWKRFARHTNNSDAFSKTFEAIKNPEEEVRTPRVGGMIIWITVLVTTGLFFLISRFIIAPLSSGLDYVSTYQTLLPLAAFFFGSLSGLFEDILEIFPERFQRFRHGLDDKYLLITVFIVAAAFAAWFYFRLDYRTVFIPFVGSVIIGWWFIPYYIVLSMGTFSSRVIDGIDGLAGGVMSIIFGAFGIIGVLHMQYDLAALCFVIAGGLLAFLWFNVPPARFYMGETGMMGLVLALPVIASLLDVSLLILVIGFPLVATAFSSFVQILSKKYFGKKIFLVAPLHHHFQALGWPDAKVVMRYWIFTLMASITGVVLVIVG